MRVFDYDAFAPFALGLCTENESKGEVQKIVKLKAPCTTTVSCKIARRSRSRSRRGMVELLAGAGCSFRVWLVYHA